MADFRSLLQQPMDDVKRPPTWPAGTYHGIVKSHEFRVSRLKKTPSVQYHLGVLSAGEDIDPDSLEGIDLSKRDLTKDYYLTEDALFRVKEFLESCGVSTTGRALGECIPEVLNARVLITVTQSATEDGKSTRNEIGDVVGEE
jgi:hypothetical protein